MKLLVTAFGPFGGRTRNASSLALAGLKQRLPWLNTRILPVDSIVAPLRMSRALREVAPDAVLMLGEAGGSKAIRLETMAWNERNFRIPDIAGRQPQGGLIDPSAAPSIASTLPFEEIHACLLEFGHACDFSSDPGRYLCNQILFHTLRVMEKRHPYAKAGFIHLPLENDYPTPRVVDALERAINVVVRDGTLRGMALSIAGLSWFGLGLYLGPQCDPLRDKALRLLKRLRTAGPASMTDLLKNHHFSKRERESLLARFVAEGLVRVEGKEVVSTTYREFVKRLHASAEFPPVVNHWEELQAQFVGAAKQET